MQLCSNPPSLRDQGCSAWTSEALTPMAMPFTYECSVKLNGETSGERTFAMDGESKANSCFAVVLLLCVVNKVFFAFTDVDARWGEKESGYDNLGYGGCVARG